MTEMKITKPQTAAEKATSTTLDTWGVTIAQMDTWVVPPFQRGLKINTKVVNLSQEIKRDGGVIPGVITIGVLKGVRYIIDGQHRREAFRMSECEIGYVDVRIAHYETMAEMADEFVKLNQSLVRMKPDDILRGLEASSTQMAKLRKKCPFIGYDQLRRSDKSPCVSMSAALRCWFGSETDTPSVGGLTATELIKRLTEEECDTLIAFMECAMEAWGRDLEYSKLWLNLNLALCMWLYRRIVLVQYSARSTRVGHDMFRKLLQSLSADTPYLEWLLGRQLRDRDRSPAYTRIRAAFNRRYEETEGKKAVLPSPDWVSSSGGRK